ncbi:MAG: methylaspartate mutase subunit E, partial [Oscillospiraceae bacterium]|nr:methylaspartate mutase subunit E [Oscillospiraceae bacterium]
MEIKNKRLTDAEFYEIRETVLNQWPTGKDVNLEEAFAFHKSLPDSKIFSKKLNEAKANKVTLVQPRAGVALVDKHIELLTYLQDKGGADLLPTTIDSYTRQNRYKEAEIGIEESIKTGKSMLNGFPAVNHGIDAVRRVVSSIDVPLQIRHGTPDARLLTEIVYAGGYTSYEGGGISYNIPYAKSVPM